MVIDVKMELKVGEGRYTDTLLWQQASIPQKIFAHFSKTHAMFSLFILHLDRMMHMGFQQ